LTIQHLEMCATESTTRKEFFGLPLIEYAMHDDLPSPTEEHIRPTELNAKRRRALGIYYTPRSAAALLAKWAIRSAADQVLEPSFGGCTILEAAVNQLRVLGCNEPSTQLFGFDVDESAFGHLRRVLGVSKHKHFTLQDFLTVTPNQTAVDAVIANPPFVSYHRMDLTQREIIRNWRTRYGPPFAMTASLWAYFLTHSISFLKTGGRMAFVLPFAAYSSDYSQPILNMLQAEFDMLAVYRMREQLFIQAGAEERTVILLAEGRRAQAGIPCKRFERPVENIQELAELLQQSNSLFYSMHQSHAPVLPNDPAMSLVHAAIGREAVRYLGDVVTIKIGEVVGDTAYLVKSGDEWDLLKVPRRSLRPLLTRVKQSPGIQLVRREISDLYGAVPFLLYPGQSKHTAIQEYLESYPSTVRLRNSTFAKRSPWYSVSYETTASAFIGSMAHESPRIIWNSAKISCANGLYKLHRRKGSRWGILLAAVASTTLFRLSAELQARVRGAGVLKLEPADVAKLMIPGTPLTLESSVTQRIVRQIDSMVRNREYESATRLADKVFYLDTGIFTPAEINVLRDRLHDLKRQRLPTRRSR